MRGNSPRPSNIDGNARRLSREGSMKGSEARPELASPDRLEEEALYRAIWKGSRRVIQSLARRGFGIKWKDKLIGVDKEAKGNDGFTAVHCAARNGHIETVLVGLLLDQRLGKELEDNDGCTALHCAPKNGHTETVGLLHDREVGKEAKGSDGCIALHYAARNGHTGTVRLLLDR
ncbi:ankyrin repeat-containing domain protein [Morchella snyderi]|nr:ankyrin repeat-containing domain protein [Morchella snyderi]